VTERLCKCGCGSSLDGRRPYAEFVNGTHQKRAKRNGGARGGAVAPAEPVAALSPGHVSKDEADRRKAVAQAELAELQLAKERGDVVPLAEIQKRVAQLDERAARFVASTRAQLLAVVGDVRSELSELTREQVAKVDAIVRRRLDATADAGERGEL
jgi:hypothetical protein